MDAGSAARLDAYAAVLECRPDAMELRSGQRHDVALLEGRGEAWRFPRTSAALEALPMSAARAALARERGLAAPEPLAVVEGPRGVARMGQSLVGGVGMVRPVVDGLAESARTQLATSIVALLAGLRSTCTDDWPGSDWSWTSRWESLAAQLRDQVVPMIATPAGRVRATWDLARAVDAARVAGAVGVSHGDLGGENVHVDPTSGHIVGVIDWDDAAPGDPALDLAAIGAHAPPWLLPALLELDPSLAGSQERANAYLGTFALQEALWGVQSGDAAAVASGLQPYA